jgi:hypothetical protein
VWRFAAWAIGAGVFAAQVRYELLRLRHSTLRAALRASSAVAIGAFGLACAAIVRGQWGDSGHQRSMVLAAVLWPLVTGLPAFLVALAAGVVTRRGMRRPHENSASQARTHGG